MALRRFVLLDPGGPLLPAIYIDDQTGVIYSDGIAQLPLQSFPLVAINTGSGSATVAGPYADDSAAAAQNIPIGGSYYLPTGYVVVRQE